RGRVVGGRGTLSRRAARRPVGVGLPVPDLGAAGRPERGGSAPRRVCPAPDRPGGAAGGHRARGGAGVVVRPARAARAHGRAPLLAARRRAVVAHLRTSLAGREDPALRPAAAGALAAADEHLAAGDVPAAARATTLALALLFHVELHAAGPASPLVEDPDAFL